MIVQADAAFRDAAEDIATKVRNNARRDGAAGSLMTVEPTFGPGPVTRYNGFFAADINGAPKPGVSSRPGAGGDGADPAECCRAAWATNGPTSSTRRRSPATRMAFIFPLCVLLVFLVLAATYEKLDAAAGHHPDRADVHPRR